MRFQTRQEALSVLPAVVDNEATEEEKRAFFLYIREHPDIRRKYEQAKRIKQLLAERCPRKKAPPHLKKKLQKQLKAETSSSGTNPNSGNGFSLSSTNRKPSAVLRYLASMAVLFLLVVVILRFLQQAGKIEPGNSAIIIEHLTAQHFAASGGDIVEPHFSTRSPGQAEQYVLEQYGTSITIPELENARFEGVFMADFVENFRTPLLEYTQPDLGENIYIFAFHIDSIRTRTQLKRHDETSGHCVKTDNYHVVEVDSHHVVSWLWDDNWYSAVSNHNGNDLALLINRR